MDEYIIVHLYNTCHPAPGRHGRTRYGHLPRRGKITASSAVMTRKTRPAYDDCRRDHTITAAICLNRIGIIARNSDMTEMGNRNNA